MLLSSTGILPYASLGVGFLLLLASASCAPSVPNRGGADQNLSSAPDLVALTKQVAALGGDCKQSVERFAETPSDKPRREVLVKLKALNGVLNETAQYEREARQMNSVDLINANRAFLEAGRAWGICSLEYNRVLVTIGERKAARYNYNGILARLNGPQFVPITRKVQAAMQELRRSEQSDRVTGAPQYSFGRGDP
jgi:hypothetical protein